MGPWTLRPPHRLVGAVSFFSGRSLVISAKSETVINRRAAEVGLYFLIPMILRLAVRSPHPRTGRNLGRQHVELREVSNRTMKVLIGFFINHQRVLELQPSGQHLLSVLGLRGLEFEAVHDDQRMFLRSHRKRCADRTAAAVSRRAIEIAARFGP